MDFLANEQIVLAFIFRRQRGQAYTFDKFESVGVSNLGMAKPLRIQYHGVFYHVTSRGNERRPVFLSQHYKERQYHDFVNVLIDQEYKDPLADVANSVILGSKEFVAEIKERFMGAQSPDRDLPALRSLSTKVSIDQIEEAVDSAFSSDEKLARQVKFAFLSSIQWLKIERNRKSTQYGTLRRIRLKAQKEKNSAKL